MPYKTHGEYHKEAMKNWRYRFWWYLLWPYYKVWIPLIIWLSKLWKGEIMTEIEIGEYGFVVDDFVAEHIRLLEGKLDDACKRVVEKCEYVDRLEQWLRLIADVCVDYDGYRSIVGLLCLVDDLQGMARRALAGDELYIGVDDD